MQDWTKIHSVFFLQHTVLRVLYILPKTWLFKFLKPSKPIKLEDQNNETKTIWIKPMWKKKKKNQTRVKKPNQTNQTQQMQPIKPSNRSNKSTQQTQIKPITNLNLTQHHRLPISNPVLINPSNSPPINPSTTTKGTWSSPALNWVVFLDSSPTSDRCRSSSWISLVGVDLSSQRHRCSGGWGVKKNTHTHTHTHTHNP